MTQISSAITLCFIPQAASGPFVFHNDIEEGMRQASELGFDAVELFFPNRDFLSPVRVAELCQRYRLRIAALGSGGGWITKQLTLSAKDASTTRDGIAFIRGLIDWIEEFSKTVPQELRSTIPVIIGSMQGRHEPDSRAETLSRFAASLRELAAYALDRNSSILYEPLNRYETNLLNRLADTSAWLESEDLASVKILADLFHMNIEERDIAGALAETMNAIGHIHWADSNRLAMGWGHTDPAPIVKALQDGKYTGYLSGEVFPNPNSYDTASQTIRSIREWIPSSSVLY
jgi:sugar phosphate isomerase/epimerase